MERAITGYHRDNAGDWVAELACGHDQHVRHRPPFQVREWTITAEGRTERLGMPLGCPLCDRAELPGSVRWVRSTPVRDEHTMPRGLRRAHRLAGGTWGRIVVHDGKLRFAAETAPTIGVQLGSGSTQAIPPEVAHEAEPLGSVHFSIDFFAVDRSARVVVPDEDGGDPACWAGLLCPECGAIRGDPHHPDCSMLA